MMEYFIISKDQLEDINTRTMKNPLGEGHGSLRITLASWEREDIIKAVMSNPLVNHDNQVREKLLNEIEQKRTELWDKNGLNFKTSWYDEDRIIRYFRDIKQE
jgi:hypothetical protein